MRLMAKGDYRDAAREQALPRAGTRQGRRPEQNARPLPAGDTSEPPPADAPMETL